MEYTEVTGLDKEEEAVTQKSRLSVSYHYSHPCNSLEEALRALLKCFGHDTKSQVHDEYQPEKAAEANPEETTASDAEHTADPSDNKEAAAAAPSSTPVTTPVVAASEVARPSLNGGSGGQTN